jgi:putative Mg2+ transporter-C (MgtC) family protein
MNFIESAQPQYQILIFVSIAMVLGALLGLDREFSDKPAGLRTHMLVAGAAALLVGISNMMVEQFTVNIGGELVRADPIRMIEAVITGVSFLGAGTIIRRQAEGSVEGLTTAASLLLVTAIGISVALSQLVLAVGVTFLALIVLRGVPFIERRFGLRKRDNR